jgi:hypothetical protein
MFPVMYEFILSVLYRTEILMWKLRPSVYGIVTATKPFFGYLLNVVYTFLTDYCLGNINGVKIGSVTVIFYFIKSRNFYQYFPNFLNNLNTSWFRSTRHTIKLLPVS